MPLTPKLAERAFPQVNHSLADVFLFDKVVPNKDSKRILRVTVDNPAVIQNVDAYYFAEILELSVVSVPDVVLHLANTLLDQLEARRDDEHRRDFDLSDSTLTSIAMTLQRMDKQLRNAGLDLFILGSSATVETVGKLDNRPLNVSHRVRQHSRRMEPAAGLRLPALLFARLEKANEIWRSGDSRGRGGFGPPSGLFYGGWKPP